MRQWIKIFFQRLEDRRFKKHLRAVQKKLNIDIWFPVGIERLRRRTHSYYGLEDRLILYWGDSGRDSAISIGLRRTTRSIQQRRYKIALTNGTSPKNE